MVIRLQYRRIITRTDPAILVTLGPAGAVFIRVLELSIAYGADGHAFLAADVGAGEAQHRALDCCQEAVDLLAV